MNLSPLLYRTVVAALVVVCADFPAGAGEEDEAQQAVEVDAESERVLRQISDFVAAADRFTFELSSVMLVEAEGMRQEMTTAHSVALERPNKFAIEGRFGMGVGTAVSDGEKLYIYMPMFGRYVVQDAPASLDDADEMSAAMVLGGAASGAAGVVNALLSEQPYERLLKHIMSVSYVGAEELEGVAHHRLRYILGQQGMTMPMDVWVQAEDRPVIRRMVPDMEAMFAKMREKMPMFGEMKMSMTVELTDWQIDPEIPQERFAFTPPEGAEQIDSFIDMFRGDGPGEAESHALLGKEAPDFELELLDGEAMKLADHKGEQIVILDFWATWCGPCIQAMPMLLEVSESYADRGVVFYAINQRERPEEVRRFMQQQEWEMMVPMDQDGAVGDLYHVRGIPQTVIIGPDGTVQAVHIGFSPDLKERLTEELDTLLAGERLAAEEREGDMIVAP